jgi:dihydroorotate dehydrogenase
MYRLFRSLLFRLDAERAHGITLSLARLGGNLPPSRWLMRWMFNFGDPRLETQAFGLTFRNPVGLAAGYDKNGVAAAGLSAIGFGHLEIGTVTRQPQAGNPRPRIHRLRDSRAVVNSMGFPNRGIGALPNQLRAQAGPDTRVGVNIGKSRDTPLDEAAGDYVALLREVHARGLADYAAVNISSPNTHDLRRLQARDRLEALLREIAIARAELQPRLPILVKVAPDLSGDEIDDVLAAVTGAGMDGLIVSNTTTSREGAPGSEKLAGGLSGAPLTARSTDLLRTMAERTHSAVPLIGVGGIMTPADALDKIRAGAWLVQVYTGMVYGGPGVASAINRALALECERQGVATVTALRGQRVG